MPVACGWPGWVPAVMFCPFWFADPVALPLSGGIWDGVMFPYPGPGMVMLSGVVQLPGAVMLLSIGGWLKLMLSKAVKFPYPGPVMAMLPVMFPKSPPGGPPGAVVFPWL